jgi:hypothetical protein
VNTRDVLFTVVYHVLILKGGHPASTIVQKALFEVDRGNFPIEGIKLVMNTMFPDEYFILPDDKKLFYKNNLKILCDLTPRNPNPTLLFVQSPTKSVVHSTIMFNGCQYTIESAILRVEFLNMESTHAICGFFCNGEPWLYDSNGIVVKSNWVTNDYNSYKTEIYVEFKHVVSDIQVDIIVYANRADFWHEKRNVL